MKEITIDEMVLIRGGDAASALVSAGSSVMQAGITQMGNGSFSSTTTVSTTGASVSWTASGTVIEGAVAVCVGAAIWAAGEIWGLF